MPSVRFRRSHQAARPGNGDQIEPLGACREYIHGGSSVKCENFAHRGVRSRLGVDKGEPQSIMYWPHWPRATSQRGGTGMGFHAPRCFSFSGSAVGEEDSRQDALSELAR